MALSQEDAVLPVVDWSPFKEEEVFKLGLVENWPKLRQILAPMISNKFGVTDAASQALVDGARIILDSSCGDINIGDDAWRNRYLVQIVVLHEGNEDEAAQVLELLLAAGVDPDKPNNFKWRPSHVCVGLGLLDVASSLFLCRPDMTAKNNNGRTPLQAAERLEYVDDHKNPKRKAMRPYVAKFLKDSGFESRFPTLAELALQKKWFAVKNLLRRQVVQPSEFAESLHGKTAAQWAEYRGEPMVAKEIQYYEQPLGTRLARAGKELLDSKREISLLKTKVAKMEQESLEAQSRMADLAEAVEVLSTKLETANAKTAP